jgi:hypothetical protein
MPVGDFRPRRIRLDNTDSILRGREMSTDRNRFASLGVIYTSWVLLLLGAASPQAPADDIIFTDVTDEAGIKFALIPPDESIFPNGHFFGGVGLADFDGNGAVDIYFSGGGGDHDTLYLNDGTGHFTDVSEAWGLDSRDLSCGVGAGDLDNDGWIDIVVASAGNPDVPGGEPGHYRLYKNVEGRRFLDIAQISGVHNVSPGPTQHPTFATPGDFNADGLLDLLYGSWQVEANGNRLYLNDGDGTFTDVTDSMGFHHQLHLARSFSANVTDMDGDLHPDITWVADFNESRYFRNNGDGTFSNLGPQNGTCQDQTAMGSAILDFNKDGRLDWFVSAIWYHEGEWEYNGNAFYMQIADHEFVNMAIPLAIQDSGWSWSSIAADLDQDGLQELVVGNGSRYPDFSNEHEYIFKQHNLNGTYYNVTSMTGLDLACQATSAAAFDMEGDGDLDLIFVCNKSRARLYRNDSVDQGSWLKVSLGGDPPNRIPNNGFNTRVEVQIGNDVQTRYMNGNPSYGASGPQTLHFGLGNIEEIDQITVRWINGQVTRLEGVRANQFIHIDPPGSFGLADLNDDGTVNGQDLLTLLSSWGMCEGINGDCTADLNLDGEVSGYDLNTLLSHWTDQP